MSPRAFAGLMIGVACAACSTATPVNKGDGGASARDAIQDAHDPIPDGLRFTDAGPEPDVLHFVDLAPRFDAAPPSDAAPSSTDAVRPPDGAVRPPDGAVRPPADAALPARDAGPGPECRLNSDCPPGQYCGAGHCTFDCRESRDCAAGQACLNGRCVVGGPDQGVPPPPFDCRADGCPAAQVCNAATHRCEAGNVGPPEGSMGAECVADADCDSGLCLGLAVAGTPHYFCSYLCCSEGECPIGYACGAASGPKFCIPSAIFPGGAYTFDAGHGQSCGPGGGACQSMICDTGHDRCEATCCTDADCGGLACLWQASASGPQQICDIPLLGFGRTGESCQFQLEFDCMDQICIADAQGNPICSDMCCTNRDCPNGFACQQVAGPGNEYVSACGPTTFGEGAQRAGCASDAGCQSGHCVRGACEEVCCHDNDCPGGQRCVPVDNGQQGSIRVCR